MIEKRLTEKPFTSIDDLVGSEVKVSSLTIRNGFGWTYGTNEIFKISDVRFRITVDGKCHTIIYLENILDRTFTLKDLIFMKSVKNVNKMKVSGRAINKKPNPAGAIKIDRPMKKKPEVKVEKGLGKYVIGSIKLE